MKVYGLFLANVHGGVDRLSLVALFTSLEHALRFEEGERALQPYTTEPEGDAYGNVHGYSLVYRPDSILKWYNPPSPNRIKPDEYGHCDSFGGLVCNEIPDDTDLRKMEHYYQVIMDPPIRAIEVQAQAQVMSEPVQIAGGV